MYNIVDTLSSRPGFVDNEYLKLYCRLIQRNKRNPIRGNLTNKHHVVPRSWFKMNNQVVDNSLQNLVNLIYRDHVLAHYYLCLCTEGSLQYANELALVCLVSKKQLNVVDKQLITKLPLYNKIYENYLERHRNGEQLYLEEIDDN